MMLDRFLIQVKHQEGVIIENPISIRYLTGVDIEQGYLVVAKDINLALRVFLLADDRFLPDVSSEKAGRQDILEKINVVRLQNFKEQIRNIFNSVGVKTVYLETSYINLKRYKYYLEVLSDFTIDFFSDLVSNGLAEIRARKTSLEILKIKEAQKLTDEAFSYIINVIKPGITEKQIAIELKKKVLSLGSEEFAFDYIVVSGENSAIPHGKPSYRELKKGDAVTIDFGAKVDGYCSDMTRTVFIGEVDKKKQRVYETVLIAQKKAIEKIQIGVAAKEIDKVARDYISKNGYGKFFMHSLGHGVGLQVHERPSLSPSSEDVIADRQVLTIEPGIYIPGEFGVRIEDMVLIDQDIKKYNKKDIRETVKENIKDIEIKQIQDIKEILTKSSKELIII